jgi:membrane protease subunit (stomatin/prohibitin family)
MALWDFVKKQFIDIIQWTEDDQGTLAYRYPMQDMEIQYGASLTVRESQLAVFVDEGRVADVFQPGRYKLTTQTIPVLTYLKNWDKLFESPFKSDVYFYSTRLQVDQKWGTPNPITFRDKEFGAVRLRAFGIYTYRIVDPKAFYLNVSGTRERYMGDDLSGQLRNTIVGSMTDLFAESGIPFLDLAANQDELAAKLREKLADNFKALGLELSGFVVENVSLPEELQKILDQRIGMNMVGDMARYTQFQVASSIPTAAANEGGVAGAGAGLGAGLAMGQAMAQSLGQTMQNSGGAQGGAPGAETKESAQDVMQLLEKLHDLKTKGVLSEDEFNTKKADLLKKLG